MAMPFLLAERSEGPGRLDQPDPGDLPGMLGNVGKRQTGTGT